MTRIFYRLFFFENGFHSGCAAGLRLLFRPKTVHYSTKNVYTSEMTFLALEP